MAKADTAVASSPLRSGFSTGAYAAATALTAWQFFGGHPWMKKRWLWFGDDRMRFINVNGVVRHADNSVEAWAVKDAGDDIDITDGAVIRARLGLCDRKAFCDMDFVERCGAATLIIRGGRGVGLVKRSGLDVPSGKWAINPVPRRMIVENLRRNGLGDSPICLLVEISIDNGRELAQRTLNPVLGIEEGLSILGTTGLVIPCSNVAYLETIRILVHGAAAAGQQEIALVTGGRTHRQVREVLPELPEYAIVRIGDFIQQALEICQDENILSVHIGCMPGKLAKYALGHPCTHAHTVSQSLVEILSVLESRGFSSASQERGDGFRSLRELMETWTAEEQQRAIRIMIDEAAGFFKQWAPRLETKIMVFNPQGELFSGCR